MDEQHLVDPLEVGCRAGVDGEPRLVGEPRHGGVRGERDPVGQHLTALGLDHVEHALLVAAERDAVGDAGAERRGEEPVERRVAGIDERPAEAGRRVGDDERAGVDAEPVRPPAHRRRHGDAGEVRRDGSAELVEPVPVAERGVRELVLVRLPGQRLVGVELERPKRILLNRRPECAGVSEAPCSTPGRTTSRTA